MTRDFGFFEINEFIMRKSTVRLIWFMLVGFSLFACTTNSTAVLTIPSMAVPTSVPVTATPRENNMPTSLPILTVSPTKTAITQATVVTDWVSFVFTDGVSIDYPAGWTVAPSSALPYVDFKPPNAEKNDTSSSVRLAVYQRPLDDRKIADPHSWEDNEGGYKVHWEKTIYVNGEEGLEFVWGSTRNEQWWSIPVLMAVYYSETYELDIRLTTFFDKENIKLAETNGLPETIRTRFGVFEHMAESIRINR